MKNKLTIACVALAAHSRLAVVAFSATATGTSLQRATVPEIHWTVPGFKVGWKDESGNWFDEDGPRDGPPLNYWRQSADQREYNRDLDVVDLLLEGSRSSSTDAARLAVEKLEGRNSARYPSLSRKVLGQWAPIMVANEWTALVTENPGCGSCDCGGFDVHVPFVMQIERTDGRRWGASNAYGIFDLKLEEGEGICVSAMDISKNMKADKANQCIELGSIEGVPLRIGSISYISDYIMIQRGPGKTIDLWLRQDKSYLGATDEEKKKYHLV